jgi:hypothetical protein
VLASATRYPTFILPPRETKPSKPLAEMSHPSPARALCKQPDSSMTCEGMDVPPLSRLRGRVAATAAGRGALPSNPGNALIKGVVKMRGPQRCGIMKSSELSKPLD